MTDTSDDSGAVAFLMEAANAPVEDATLALERSGGNKQKALKLLTSGGDNFKMPSVSDADASKGSKMDENTEMADDARVQKDTGTCKNHRYSFH